MRKSEKLSDAIGEISDDIIEEAYTYKPKHDMHQRKASFKSVSYTHLTLPTIA